jgi:hypothetical protein
MWVTYAGLPTLEPMIEMTFSLRLGGVSSLGFVHHDAVVNAYFNPGTFVGYASVPDAPVFIARLREDAGTMRWEMSLDGTLFSVIATQPTPADVSSVGVGLEAGTYGTAPNPGTATYDSFNTP